jgi:hypothetical protein
VRRTLAAVLLAAALPAAAVAATPQRTTALKRGALRAARRALLRATDLGPEWSVTQAAPRKPPALACRAAAPGVLALAASPTWAESSTGPFVQGTAYGFADAPAQARAWRGAVGARLGPCLRSEFARGSESGVRLSPQSVGVQRFPREPARGRPAAVLLLRVSGTASTSGESVPAYLDALLIGQGRAIVRIELSSLNEAPEQGLELKLARRALARMPNVLPKPKPGGRAPGVR